jgi:hypothetical protein
MIPGFRLVSIPKQRVRSWLIARNYRRSLARMVFARPNERLPDSLQAVHHMDLGPECLASVTSIAAHAVAVAVYLFQAGSTSRTGIIGHVGDPHPGLGVGELTEHVVAHQPTRRNPRISWAIHALP